MKVLTEQTGKGCKAGEALGFCAMIAGFLLMIVGYDPGAMFPLGGISFEASARLCGGGAIAMCFFWLVRWWRYG